MEIKNNKLMKKIFVFLIIILLSVSYSEKLVAQDFTDAFEYLSYIDEKQNEISQDMWTYISASAHSNRDRKISRKKSDLIQTINAAKNDIKRMPSLDGNSDLRDSMVAYLDYSAKLLTGDLTVMEAMELDSKLSYKAMKKYLDKVDEVNQKFSDQGDRLHKEFEKFAAVNDIELTQTTSDLEVKMQTAKVVNDYYNEVYLIYFRVAIAETFAIKAINTDDTIALAQWIDSMVVAIKDGNVELKKIGAYKGDLSVKFSCQKAMNNFNLEATNYLPKILNYYDVQRQIDIAKANYENKSQSDITQGDIDAYNSTVENYNNAINEYNDVIDKMTKLQKNNSAQWNDASDKFLDKNIPK